MLGPRPFPLSPRSAHARRATAALLALTLGGALVGAWSCGGGGGIGLAIATVGVSAIFAGGSPGAYAIDPLLVNATDANSGVAVSLEKEDDVLLDVTGPSTTIRYLVLGGKPLEPDGALRLVFSWEATTSTSQLVVTVSVRDGDDDGYEDVIDTLGAVRVLDTPGPQDLSFNLAGQGLQAGDVLQIVFTATQDGATVFFKSRPAFAEVTVDVTDPRVELAVARDPTGGAGILAQRATSTQPILVSPGQPFNFDYHLSLGLTPFASSTYGGASSSPPELLEYNFLNLVDTDVILRVKTEDPDPSGPTATFTVRVILHDGSPTTTESLDLGPFTVAPAADPVIVEGAFDFPAGTPPALVRRLTSAVPRSEPLFRVQILVDPLSQGLFIEPGSIVRIPAPVVVGEFVRAGGQEVRVPLTQPARGVQ